MLREHPGWVCANPACGAPQQTVLVKCQRCGWMVARSATEVEMKQPYIPQSAYSPGQAQMQDQIDRLERRLAECERILEALRTMPSAHLVRASDVRG